MLPPTYELEVFWGEERRRIPLAAAGEVQIGRGEGCQVRIEHPSVSRRHAALRSDGGLFIRDLGAANGTVVRDRGRPRASNETENVRQLRDEEAEIAVGEPIMIGVVTLVVRHAKGESRAEGTAESRFVRLDPAMQALYAQVDRVANSMLNVLVLGETGVGKEVLARSIHERSPRADKPFLSLNCAALTESLLESELFGHEKGAFTGAAQTQPGLFETASTGTVFLDEVGELPLSTQAKLLRVIEQRRVRRVGGREDRPIDVRFVSATNRDLEAAAAAGAFRSDLYFRLNGISLTIPPLRERPSEIEPLARHFLEANCRELERVVMDFAPETLERLCGYAWPGNVRELRNVVDRAVVLCPGEVIFPDQLPPQFFKQPAAAGSPLPAHTAVDTVAEALRGRIRELKRTRVVEALASCGGNQTEAAKVLGVSRRTLVNLLDEFELPRPRGRRGD